MSKLPVLVGGSALAVYLWSRSRNTTPAIARPTSVPGDWVWPLPAWNGRAPTISDGFDSPRTGYPRHGGVDLMYRRIPTDALRVGSPNGSKAFVMPDGTKALAAADGVVWSALRTPQGFAVVIQHAQPFATFYTHLEQLLVAETARGVSNQRVRAGQPIGIVGASPLDAEHLKHLHFELWAGGAKDKMDPALAMREWRVVAEPPTALVARNASLNYRPLGDRGEPYPQWVRDLKEKSGAYIIRDRETREIVYVGSSQGSLYETLTRHFQQVRHEAKEIPMT
jgi:murein DD-endopeptidase MepM/ murein hydrolase activator NlpD